MIASIVVAFVLGQAPVADAPPGPASGPASAPTSAPAPAVLTAPETTSETPPPMVVPGIPPPAVAPAPTPTPVADVVQPAGQSAVVTGVAQWGTGVGIDLAFLALSYVPLLGLCTSCIGCTLGPAIIASSEVMVGDLLGTKRGALLWPVVSMYVARILLGMVAVGISLALVGPAYAAFFAAAQSGDQAALETASAALTAATAAILPVTLGVGIGSTLVASAVPALVYGLMAEDKEPGDTGGGFPGLLSPADPTGTRAKKALTPTTQPPPPTPAQAF